MENSRKVALVPQALLSSLIAQQQLNPAFGQLSNLDQDMQNVLQSSTLPPDLKHKQYSQMMHRYQTLRDHEINRKFPVNVTQHEDGQSMVPADDIIENLPKNFKNKGRLLLSHIKRTDNIDVDDIGQVVIDGKTIQGSNITDLVYDFVKPGKRGAYWGPTGWKEFGKFLKRTNVPREAIVNTSRWNQIDLPTFGLQLEPPPPEQPHSELEDSVTEFQTPTGTKRSRSSTPVPGPSRSPVETAVNVRKGTRNRKQFQPYSPYIEPKKWRKYQQK